MQKLQQVIDILLIEILCLSAAFPLDWKLEINLNREPEISYYLHSRLYYFSLFFKVQMLYKIFFSINGNQGKSVAQLLIHVEYLRRIAALYAENIICQEVKSNTIRGKFFGWLISWTGFTNFCNRRLLLATFNSCQESLQTGILILLRIQKLSVPDKLSLSELIERYSRYLPSRLTKQLERSHFIQVPLTVSLSFHSVLEAYLLSEKCRKVIAMQLELLAT